MSSPLKIGLVAGESSGDQLGAGIIRSLKSHYPDAQFEGIGGDKMLSEGFRSLFPMDRLSVMGFIEPLKRLPELLRIRRNLYHHFIKNRFDLVVGIDSPDFNLGLEKKLRQQGLLTAHYVSPSVWAWRQGRVKKIASAVDLMLTLLPFEADFYKQHDVPVVFVGHPLAEEIPLVTDSMQARKTLNLPEVGRILTLMPGSRASEVDSLGRLFLEVAQSCRRRLPGLHLIVPAASHDRLEQLNGLLNEYPELSVTLLEGQSHLAMAAADVVLLSSGTSALEALLLNKPMVVSYRLGKWTYALVSRMLKVPWVSLPNLLASETLVPELLQDNATVDKLSDAVLAYFLDEKKVRVLQQRFTELHQTLRHGGNRAAAQALVDLLEDRRR
ncbi:lipid-A-disaccharide synthase [uncultured Porticoccus sp.]|uniref:lipid-A-disaccharide synthase n=1 Tax=uncultured Porticoccus sp. TaxID=1256050 RepID=UPI00261BECEC|nr:lipid-A-disaccharide synthase [uncultured Porticoccus sp.]